MRIVEDISLLSQAVLRFLLPTAPTCQLYDWLPQPLRTLRGECIPVDTCLGQLGYATAGFCHGPDTIQCCMSSYADDNGMATMPDGKLSDWGWKLVQAFEGWVDNFYCDNATHTTYGHRHCLPGEGRLTIGWGHLCDPECSWDFITRLPITKTGCGLDLMTGDVNRMEAAVNGGLDVTVLVTLPIPSRIGHIADNFPRKKITQNQFDALISYAFVIGGNGVRPALVAINSGDFAAAENMIRTGIGDKIRRSIEANVFISF